MAQAEGVAAQQMEKAEQAKIFEETITLRASGAAGGAPPACLPLLLVLYRTAAAQAQPLYTLAIARLRTAG